MADANSDTDQIERDLARTRERMDHRLDELGQRLQPNQLVNDALAQVSGGSGADFTRTLVAKARANPVPAALAGIGLAWLLASSGRQASAASGEDDLAGRLRLAEADVVRRQDETDEDHAGRLDEARGKVLGLVHQASDTTAVYRQRVGETLAAAGQGLRATSGEVRRGASEAADRIGRARRAAPITGRTLAMGGAAAAAGLIAGALIPVSDAEQRTLGNTADRLRGAGRDAAQGLVDHGAQVVGEAIGAAKDSAQAHGLTAGRSIGELIGDLKSGELVDHVKQAAQEVASAGRDSVQTHLTGGTDQA